MLTLSPDQFSSQAVSALQQAAALASKMRAPSLSPIHLLYGVLNQKEADAAGVLAGLGHDAGAMARTIKEEFGSRQMVHWNAGEKSQEKLDPALQYVLAGAIREAQAVGVSFATTRDLLVSVLANPTSEVTEWLQRWPVDVEAVRQAPVSVYEVSAASVEAQEQRVKEKEKVRRKQMRVSPIFLGLVAALVGLGALLYWMEEPPPVLLFIFVTVGWIISLALHEFGHAIMAYIGGDSGTAERGYLTLNPLKYTHPLLSIIMPVIFLMLGGIGLPGGAVYVNLGAIRSRWMQSVVSASGPAANALFAGVLAIPFLVSQDIYLFVDHFYFWSGVGFLIFLQITAILLNLIPIPGLDGFGILSPWLPMSVHRMLAPLYSFGMFLLIFMFWYVDAFNQWFWAIAWTLLIELQIPPELVQVGYEMYRFWQ